MSTMLQLRKLLLIILVSAPAPWAGCGGSSKSEPTSIDSGATAQAGGKGQVDAAQAADGAWGGGGGWDGGAAEAGLDSSAVGGSLDAAGVSGGGGTAIDAGLDAGATNNDSLDAPALERYLVAMVQSPKAEATDLTIEDVAALVADAVAKAGGLDFIEDGQTVVLKPNLVTAYADLFKTKPVDPAVNGIATDWRVVKAVADLVRARNPHGKILIMEGSVIPTPTAYAMLGYTQENFGSSVDELATFEGASCADVSTGALEQRAAASGVKYWVNSRYANADVVISIPTMKTHVVAGITGSVKNLGVGATPVGQYSAGTNAAADCTRGQTAAHIDHSSPETLGQFIRDYYSVRPADFVVMDALQGLAHGPLPAWDNSGKYDYESSRMNMRLILAGRNAVAVDTVESLVMKCDPKKVPHLTKLESDGLGTTDMAKITLVGKQVDEVAKPFAGKQTDICPGQ
jgi:uncharacterized protein (DUF362 family)